MIAQHALNWQQQQADAITDLHELLELLQITMADLPLALQACADFPLRVPRSFAARMEKGNPQDPLLRQVLAVGEELTVTPGFSQDRSEEHTSELQSRGHLVCRLLLAKKKYTNQI